MEPLTKPVRAHIAHAAPGRLRLRAPELMNQQERMTALAETLATVPNMTRISARPQTASMIFHFEGGTADFARKLFSTDQLVLTAPPIDGLPLSQVTRFGAARLDHAIREQTGEVLDGKTMLALFLFAIAVFQASQGRMFGPTSTLMMSVFTLLSKTDAK